MVIYEMIFRKGPNESSHRFYAEDTETSRRDFIELIRMELEQELQSYKTQCQTNSHNDLLNLLKEIHKESHQDLDRMEEKFVKRGFAQLDVSISLISIVRKVRVLH